MNYVIMNARTGEFLALPEGKRAGAPAVIRVHAAEWTNLDHAARLDAEQAAAIILRERLVPIARLLTLREAWGVAP